MEIFDTHVHYSLDTTLEDAVRLFRREFDMLGIKNTVAHNGFAEGLSKEEWFVKNKAFYEKLFSTMERCGVNVLCENSTAANMKDKYFINTGKDMREFIK